MTRKLEPTERQMQAAFFDIVRRNTKQYPALNLCFSVPNGAWLAGNARERAIRMNAMKRAGLMPGVFDVILLAPNDKYHALALEFKRHKRYPLSTEQLRWQSYATMFGVECHAVSDPEKAWELVKAYLGIN